MDYSRKNRSIQILNSAGSQAHVMQAISGSSLETGGASRTQQAESDFFITFYYKMHAVRIEFYPYFAAHIPVALSHTCYRVAAGF